jgi:hypothetical protein
VWWSCYHHLLVLLLTLLFHQPAQNLLQLGPFLIEQEMVLVLAQKLWLSSNLLSSFLV